MCNTPQPIETFEIDDLTVNIFPDDDPASPREWDNLGKMVCFHSRYNLGDEQPGDHDEWLRELAESLDDGLAERLDYWENGKGWAMCQNYGDKLHPTDYVKSWRAASSMVDAKMHAAIDKVLAREAVILPLYLYDHSGLSMSTGASSCLWDSGQVGYIYATRADVLNEYSAKIMTAKVRERARACLKGEVQTYDQFLTGDVYGYVIEDADGEHVDSCWGFYGLDDCIQEARGSAEWHAKDRAAKAAEDEAERDLFHAAALLF